MKKVLLVGALLAASPAHPNDRPRVGLALGGGSARGIAHVGVLEWLEENQVPVDFVAGTSMGGLVGGAFATGMRGSEIRTLLRNVDWDLTFLGEAPYGSKSFRRKEDRREFPVRLEIGLAGGIKFPSGLDPAHQVGLLLSRIALPYAAPLDFDDLPTPFRCVATDMERAEIVVLGEGSLSQALLATMAIPGVFPPVRRNGQVLADGGVLANVPADVVPRERVDVVIAVDVGANLETVDLDSALTSASQAIDVMMAARAREALESADIVITPDLREFGSFDWRRSDAIADVGRMATEEHRDVLSSFQLDDEAWAEYRETRRSKTRAYDQAPGFIEVTGIQGPLQESIEQRLDPFVAAPLDIAEWHEELTAITGTGRYESLRYEHRDEDDVHGLLVPTKPKSYAPPLLRFDVGLSNETQEVDFNFGARLIDLDVGKPGAEIRVQGDLGVRLGASAEYYYPLIGRSVFVAPRVFAVRQLRSEFEGDDLVASRRDRRTATGIDLGVSTRRNAELRIGYQLGDVKSSIRVGDPNLPQPAGREEFFRARFVYDGHNAPLIPTRGVRTTWSVEWFRDAPGAERPFGRARVDFSAFVPRGATDAVYLIGRAGGALGDSLPFFYDFGLGGPFQLSSLELDELRADHVVFGSIGYLRQVSRLPDILGGPIYLTAFFENGSAFDAFDDAEYRFSAGGGVLVNTAIGPLFATVSGGSGGRFQFYFTLGRFFASRR